MRKLTKAEVDKVVMQYLQPFQSFQGRTKLLQKIMRMTKPGGMMGPSAEGGMQKQVRY